MEFEVNRVVVTVFSSAVAVSTGIVLLGLFMFTVGFGFVDLVVRWNC